jgi:antitoxin ParD1/3/4
LVTEETRERAAARRRTASLELEHLRQPVREGIESGPSIPADDVFGHLQTKYAAMAIKPE